MTAITVSPTPTAPAPIPVPAPVLRPADVGLHSVFADYYPGQAEAVTRILNSPARVIGVCAPTGFGKSVLPAMLHAITGERTAILTATKNLQGQYQGLLTHSLALSDVRGQSSYQCREAPDRTVELGPCHAGWKCSYREGGCHYFDAVRHAQGGALISTNYAFWMARRDVREDDQLGEFGLLVCDEADTLFDVLSGYLAAEIRRADLKRVLQGAELPPADSDLESVKVWAGKLRKLIPPDRDGVSDHVFPSKAESEGMAARRRVRKALDTIITARGHWIVEFSTRLGTLTVTPVWPVEYVEGVVYQGIPRVVLMSATLDRRTMALLTPDGEESEYLEFPSRVPVRDREVIHVWTTNMSRGRENTAAWLTTIDHLVRNRGDRRSLIQTTSYNRQRQFIGGTLINPAWLVSHQQTAEDTERALIRYRTMGPPAVLVSPSMVRGVDLPGDDCRLVVIGKTPWPPPSALRKAREVWDKDYAAYVAMQAFQQECGRAVRYVGDWAEIIVVDDAWSYGRDKFKPFLLPWFVEAVSYQSRRELPEPRRLDR